MALEQADLDKIAEMIKTNNEGLDIGAQVAAGLKGLNLAASIETAVTTRLDAAAAEAKTAADAAAKAKKEAEANGEQKIDPRTAARLADMETKLASANQRSKEAETARKNEALVVAGRSALAKAGVQPNRIDHAMALLHSAQGRLRTDTDGHPVVYFRRTGGPTNDYDEEVGLTAGIEEWVKTDDGKAFLPAIEGGGTGGGAGKKQGAGGSQNATTHDELAGALMHGIFTR